MPNKDWWHALWPDPEGVLRAVAIGTGIDVIDLCCGDGYFTAPMCRLTAPGHVIGVDLDTNMLEQAKTACRDSANFVPALGDGRDLPKLIGQPVDYVLIANTFHGVPDKTGLARAANQVLKPEGRFTVINWYPLPREQTVVLGQPRGPATALRMAPDAVALAVAPAGFESDRVVDLPPFHYAAIFVKTAPK
jgi:SAM-dependent methyltransferase